MATVSIWVEESILLTVWEAPLNPAELRRSFNSLTQTVSDIGGCVDVVFDITEAGGVSRETLVLAVGSGFLQSGCTRKLVVIGAGQPAKTLAQVIEHAFHKPVRIVHTYEEAAIVVAQKPDSV